jgi:hypothetical protein
MDGERSPSVQMGGGERAPHLGGLEACSKIKMRNIFRHGSECQHQNIIYTECVADCKIPSERGGSHLCTNKSLKMSGFAMQ